MSFCFFMTPAQPCKTIDTLTLALLSSVHVIHVFVFICPLPGKSKSLIFGIFTRQCTCYTCMVLLFHCTFAPMYVFVALHKSGGIASSKVSVSILSEPGPLSIFSHLLSWGISVLYCIFVPAVFCT